MSSFATQLKLLRTEFNVTQQELADYLHVTRPTIAGYETKGKEPDYYTLLLLSSFFHVSTDYLLTGKNFPQSIKEETLHSADRVAYQNLLNARGVHDELILKLIEQSKSMQSYDLERMLDYGKLLLLQPQYKKRNTDNNEEQK